MGRYLSWLANTGLFVLSCFLIANTANTVFASLLTPEPDAVAARPDAAPLAARSWKDREVILERNLFNASLLAPPAPPVEEPEELEATRLPLSLLGTVAALDPALSWAAVQDLEARKTLVLKNGDPVKKNAEVLRIERRRVVLLENGAPRELALDDDDNARPAPPRRGVAARKGRRGRRTALRAPRPAQDTASRVRELGDNRYEVPREEIDQAVRNPASIFSQAQIQPKYDGGEMIGMQINAIKPGSIFEQMGIQSGEIITELNGIAIDSPEASGQILTEFSDAPEFNVVVEDENGEPRTVTFSPDQ